MLDSRQLKGKRVRMELSISEIQEAIFRKGFQHGYRRALADMKALLEEGLHLDAAYDTCITFVGNEIYEWRLKVDGEKTPAPDLIPPA